MGGTRSRGRSASPGRCWPWARPARSRPSRSRPEGSQCHFPEFELWFEKKIIILLIITTANYFFHLGKQRQCVWRTCRFPEFELWFDKNKIKIIVLCIEADYVSLNLSSYKTNFLVFLNIKELPKFFAFRVNKSPPIKIVYPRNISWYSGSRLL